MMSRKDNKKRKQFVLSSEKAKRFTVDKLTEEEYAKILKAYKRQFLDEQKDRD